MDAGRGWVLVAGLALATGIMVSPLSTLAGQLLVIHTLQQILLLLAVAPLLVYGLGSKLSGRLGPLEHPVAGLLAYNLALLGWQHPAVAAAAAHSGLLKVALSIALVGLGMCFWWPLLRPGGLSPIARLGYLLVAGVPPTIPGAVLGLSHHLFYPGYQSSGRPFGLNPLEDQQLAGLLLFGAAKLALISGMFVILWRLLEGSGEEPPEDNDQGAPDPLPPSGPAWLCRLEEELPEEPVAHRPVAGVVR